MTSVPPDQAPARTGVDFLAVLEGLAAFDGELSEDVRRNDDLRRRVLLSVQRLVSELETPAETAQRILYNELELCAARIGVDLDVFSILSASTKSMTTEEIATQTGVHPDINLLARILRYMASVGMIREVSAGLWAQSNYGSNLTDKRQRAGICHVHESVLPAYLALPEFLRAKNYQVPISNTDTPFVRGHRAEPTTFFNWLQFHPANAGYFHEFMNVHRTGVRTWLDDKTATGMVIDVLREKDHPEAILFVDVGGGMGQQCKLLKSRYPDLLGKIILEDLPEVVDKVDTEEAEFDKIGMSFFESQPVKANYSGSTYLDWPDESCRTILGHIRDAMQQESILVIDDLVLPDFGAHKFETQLDLTMLAMLNGQARTRGHWQELLVQAGLVVSEIRVYEEEAREAIIVARKSEPIALE
ncbi:S-adenosyl-L-methionine-dependent methyltransferase [Ustulina deusta]|nr:S-adenosyl-L-methionine-dependent methyltransferase [Ustulina deusta]